MLKPGDSIVPLIIFRSRRARLLEEEAETLAERLKDTTPRQIHFVKFDIRNIDSIYSFPKYSGNDICEVHHCVLQVDTVPISYGLITAEIETKKGYTDAKHKTFPNANDAVGMGCSITNYPNFAEVLFCPVCRLHRRDWFDDYLGN
jgi:hypothetical protein